MAPPPPPRRKPMAALFLAEKGKGSPLRNGGSSPSEKPITAPDNAPVKKPMTAPNLACDFCPRLTSRCVTEASGHSVVSRTSVSARSARNLNVARPAKPTVRGRHPNPRAGSQRLLRLSSFDPPPLRRECTGKMLSIGFRYHTSNDVVEGCRLLRGTVRRGLSPIRASYG